MPNKMPNKKQAACKREARSKPAQACTLHLCLTSVLLPSLLPLNSSIVAVCNLQQRSDRHTISSSTHARQTGDTAGCWPSGVLSRSIPRKNSRFERWIVVRPSRAERTTRRTRPRGYILPIFANTIRACGELVAWRIGSIANWLHSELVAQSGGLAGWQVPSTWCGVLLPGIPLLPPYGSQNSQNHYVGNSVDIIGSSNALRAIAWHSRAPAPVIQARLYCLLPLLPNTVLHGTPCQSALGSLVLVPIMRHADPRTPDPTTRHSYSQPPSLLAVHPSTLSIARRRWASKSALSAASTRTVLSASVVAMYRNVVKPRCTENRFPRTPDAPPSHT